MSGNPFRGPSSTPPSAPGGGSSNQNCPSGQHLDSSSGQCVQNCRANQRNFQGECVHECPPGMTLNDEKVCIRPIFNRSVPVTDVQHVTVLAGGYSEKDNTNQLIVGAQSSQEKDIAFTGLELKGRPLSLTNITKLSGPTKENENLVLIGESTSDNPEVPTSAPMEIAEIFTSASKDPFNNIKTRIITGLSQNIGKNAGLASQIQKEIQTFSDLGGSSFQLTGGILTGPDVSFQSNTSATGVNVIPKSMAKVYANPNTSTYYVKTDGNSAQSNTIFNGTLNTDSKFQMTFESAQTASENTDLILSGGHGIERRGNLIGLQAVGRSYNYITQQTVDSVESQYQEFSTAIAARTFSDVNDKLPWPGNTVPKEVAHPYAQYRKQVVDENGGVSQIAETAQINKGYLNVGQARNALRDSTAFMLASTFYYDAVQEEDLSKNRNEVNTNLQTNQNKATPTNDSSIQPTHLIRFERPYAFQPNGLPQTPTGGNSADVRNTVYLVGRAFNYQNKSQQNQATSPTPTLSQIQEHGQAAGSVDFSGPTMATGTSTVVPQLWAISGELGHTSLPQNEKSTVQCTAIESSTHNMVGDMYQNSADDAFAVSFADGFIPTQKSLENLVNNGVSIVADGSSLEQKLIRFEQTGTPQKIVIPANCVNVHVLLWGAGGSAEEGIGGSGSFVEGDLIPNEDPTWWNVGRESTLYVVVGGGGNADSAFLNGAGSFGGGGVGQQSGIGQGGGRTSLQSKVVSNTRYQLVDRVVAGGGGGSTGGGTGGNAGHFVVDTLQQSSLGEPGSPTKNGGQGGQVLLSKGVSFQSKVTGSPGKGGIVQGQAYNTAAQAGGLSYGGNSQNFPTGLSAVGCGGGGGGYFGGGAGAQLGNSVSKDDLPSGGGGGTSFAPTHSLRNLYSTKGNGILGPSTSPLGSAIIVNRPTTATGGSADRNQGGHGQAAIILTVQKNVSKVNSAAPAQQPLQYSLGQFDPRVQRPFDWDDSSDVNNTYRCRAATFSNGIPTSPLVAVYISSNLLIACEFGDLYNETTQKKGVWAATRSGSGFSNMDNSGSSFFAGFSNVQAIRDVNGYETSNPGNGTTTLAFLGNGIRIVQIKVISGTIQWTVQNVTSTINDLPFDDNIIFNDGNYNGSNGGQFIACGYPSKISMSVALQCSLLPLFNGGYEVPDAKNYFLAQNTSLNWPDFMKMNRQDYWPPSSPTEMSNQVQMQGGIVDNTIKYAIVDDVPQTNDLANYVISIGGYLLWTQDAIQSDAPERNPITAKVQRVLPGTPQAFQITQQSGKVSSSILDFTTGQEIGQQSILDGNVPFIRSPSTILISVDGGQSFTLTTSEQTQESIQNAGNLKGPLTEYVCLPMDLPHDSTAAGATVQTSFTSESDQNPITKCYFQRTNEEQRTQSLASRFQDVAFLPDAIKNDGSGYFVVAGCFVQDLNLCHFLGGQLPIASNAKESSEVVPQNTSESPSVTNGQLMNNMLWMIHTDDITKAKNTNKKFVFKARPMQTQAEHDNFYACFKLATSKDLQDLTGNTIENELQMTTDVGLYKISQSAIDKAYNTNYFSGGSFSSEAAIQVSSLADDTRCTKDVCVTCLKKQAKITFQVGAAQPVQQLCASKQDSTAVDNSGNEPRFYERLDNDADVQRQYQFLDIYTAPTQQAIVGPNVYEQETATESEGAFLGRILQGPFSGPDEFNVAIQVSSGFDQKSPSAPVDPIVIENGQANNIQNNAGQTGPVSQRKRNPVTGYENTQQQQPFLMDPFLGLPCSFQDESLIVPWDSFVDNRMQQKGLTNVQIGLVPTTSTDLDNRLWMGYVDACRSDYNGFLFNGQQTAGSNPLTGTFLPSQTPLTQTTAFSSEEGNLDPDTNPFNKIGNLTGDQPIFDLVGKTNSNLFLGAQNLYPLTDDVLSLSNAPTGNFATTFNDLLIGSISPANQGVQNVQDYISQTREEGIVPDTIQKSNLQTFVASVDNGTTNIRSFRDLLQLDLTHFFTNQFNTNSENDTGNFSANLGQTLALTTSTVGGSPDGTPLSNFWNQQATRLLVKMGESTPVTLQLTASPSIDNATSYSAQQLMVTTNFFRGRNWSFQWPENALSVALPPTPTFGQFNFFCDQPSQALQNPLTEWLSPDPFLQHQSLGNAQSPVTINTASEIFSQGNVFNYVLGLTYVQVQDANCTLNWTHNDISTQVPLRESGLPLPTAIKYATIASIPVPDSQPYFAPNEVGVWLAEDAKIVPQKFPGTTSNSPLYGSCHGTYFSNLRYQTGSGTTLLDNPAQQYTVQMDVFINCTLMSRRTDENYYFQFGDYTAETAPLWQKALTSYLEGQDFSTPGNFDPFTSVVFLDSMTDENGAPRGEGYSLADLATFLAGATRNAECKISQNLVPQQNQVLLVDSPLPKTSTGVYPTFASTAASSIDAYGPFNFKNQCTVTTHDEISPTTFTYPDGTSVSVGVTTALQFLRFSQTLQLPVSEILDTYFKSRSGIVNPIVWTVPLDAYPTDSVSKSKSVVPNQQIQFTSINVNNADITLPKVPAGATDVATFPMLGLNYGVNVDILKNQTCPNASKNMFYNLAGNRNLNRAPAKYGSNDQTDFINNSAAIETQVTLFDIYQQDDDANSVGINATYKFQDTALAADSYFNAKLQQSQPYNPFQIKLQQVPVNKPFCIGPPGDFNVDLGIRFPDYSAQLKQVTEDLWQFMNVQHLNPFMQMSTYREQFYMIPDGLSSERAGQVNQKKHALRTGGVGQTRTQGQNSSEIVVNNAYFGSLEKFGAGPSKDPNVQSPQLQGVNIPWTLLPMDCDNTRKATNDWKTNISPSTRLQALPNNFLVLQAQQGLPFDSSNPLASADSQPAFSLFAGFDHVSGGTNKFQRFFADLVPFGLGPAPQDAIPSPNSQGNYLQSWQDPSFMKPISVDPTQLLGSKNNPILIMTNRLKDVYHNGMNGSTQSTPQVEGANVSQMPLCSTSTGFFYVDENPTWDPQHIEPPQQTPYDGNLLFIWQQSYIANSVNGDRIWMNLWISKNNLPQTQVQLMQMHNDKVYIQVKKSCWLNFPNWAVKIPNQNFFLGSAPNVLSTEAQNTEDSPYFLTPSKFGVPKTYDPVQVQGRTVGADDSVNYFNGGSHNSNHFFVMTNRNQNDLPSVVFQQNVANTEEPPVFGWVMTQFDNTTYEKGPFGQETNLIPDDTMTDFMGINQVLYNNNGQTLSFTQPATGAGPFAGATNKNFFFTSNYFATIVNSSLKSGGGVNSVSFPNMPSFGTTQLPQNIVTASGPTTIFPRFGDPGASSITLDMPTVASRAFRFDCGSVFARTSQKVGNLPRNDPRTSAFATANGTTGISVYIDITYGNTLCFTQTALREMEAKGVQDPNLPQVPPVSSFDSWPGATDLGCVVYNDTSFKNGYTIDSWNVQANGGTDSWASNGLDPDCIAYCTSRPTLPMATLNVATKGKLPYNFGFWNPLDRATCIWGYGAQGTQVNDDPQVICCYFSDFPDFTSNRYGDDVNVYATSDQVDSEIPQTDAPVQVNQSSDMDVSQVQPSSTQVLDVKAPDSVVGALGSSRFQASKKIVSIQGNRTVINNVRLTQSNAVAPLSCILRDDSNASNYWNTPSPQKPQLVPDYSGLALSVWAYAKAMNSPVSFPEWSWTSSNESNQVIGQLTATTPESQAFFKTNNVPYFWKTSAFVKYAMGFTPLTTVVFGLQSGTRDAAYLNDSGLLVPIGTFKSQTADPNENNKYQVARSQGPLVETEKSWNTGVSNSINPNQTRPGGLYCTPLRAFEFGLGNLSDTSVFSIATNTYLNSSNRILLGCSNGTVRVLDSIKNITLYATAPGGFVTLTKNTIAAGGQTSSFVNINNIQAMQFFADTWFIATDMGLFQTPIDPTIPLLRNNTLDNIRFFVAPDLIFVQIRPQENLDASFKSGATTEEIQDIGGQTFPPCTGLKEVAFKDKSYLLVSYPDQAQGFFTKFNSKTVFTPLDALGPATQDQPYNGGLGFGPGWQATGDGNVACSFQIVYETANAGLKKFKQAVKFTGLPTVGAQWTFGRDTQDPYTLTTTNTVQNAPTYINSHMTDIVLRQTQAVYSTLQVPFRKEAGVPDKDAPNVWLFASAVGKTAGFLSSVNEVLCPIPETNSFIRTSDPNSGDDTSTIQLANFKTPIPARQMLGDATATKNITGDMSIRICQNAKITYDAISNIVLDDDSSVTQFLNPFFSNIELLLQESVDPFTVATSDYYAADPMSYYSLLGQVYTRQTWDSTKKQSTLGGGPLSNIQLRYQLVYGRSYGIGPFSLAVGVVSNALQSLDINNKTYIQPMFVAGIETDPLMQAQWGFAGDSLLKQGLLLKNEKQPNPSTIMPLPPDFQSNETYPSAFDKQQLIWTTDFNFFAVRKPNQQNTCIFQWSPGVPTKDKTVRFRPKDYVPGSGLNETSITITTANEVPPLFETLFEDIFVQRANLLSPNDTIGDFAFADLSGGILTWTLGGPYNVSPIQMSRPTVVDINNQVITAGLDNKGNVILPIQSAVEQTSTKEQTTDSLGKTVPVSQFAPSFGLPVIHSNSVMAYNPQTQEFYCAGQGSFVDDEIYMNQQVLQTQQPNGVLSQNSKLFAKGTVRFMIAQNPGARGSPFAENNYVTGVPSRATDLLPSTLNWLQVATELPQSPTNGSSSKKQVTLLSEAFAGFFQNNDKVVTQPGPARVNCFAFSPNTTAIGGSQFSIVPSVSSTTRTTTTALWYRQNNTWQQGSLLVQGEITAMDYVGYGWYIAVWNEVVQVSSMYFASANFTAIVLMDTWGPEQNALKIITLRHLQGKALSPCDPAQNLVPNPNNPNTCLKNCPSNFEAFNDFCALICPKDLGFQVTEFPNECKPPKYKALQVAPTNGLIKKSKATQNGKAPETSFLDMSQPGENVVFKTIIIVIPVILFLLFMAQLQVQFNKTF